MSASLSLEEDFRALQLFDQVPASHVGIMVTNIDLDPHLRRSQMVIAHAPPSCLSELGTVQPFHQNGIVK